LAEIVEFCGAPGAGKTTIYRDLVSSWKKGYGWIPGDRLYPRVHVQYKTLPGFLRTAVKSLKNDIDVSVMNAAVQQFTQDNKAFVDSLWKNIVCRQKHHLDGSDNRFRAVEIWLNVLRKIQIIGEYRSTQLAVIDEGLIQRIDSALHKSTTPDDELTEIAELLETIPLPKAVIYIDVEPDIVIARLKLRSKRMPFFDDLPPADLARIYQIYKTRWLSTFELLERKGVSVLRVNSAMSTKENVVSILDFLDSISVKARQQS
jgi:hypothetical protein